MLHHAWKGQSLANVESADGIDRGLLGAMQALTEAKANDLLFWASRYHLFVHWSPNRAHPWDKLPNSEAACATLEIGKLRDSEGQV